MRIYLNDGWQYFKKFSADVFGDVNGENVRIPHANAVTPFNNFDESVYQFEFGYKRNLHLDNIANKTYLLTFEGVAHFAEVFVNGKSVCTHASGYTAFCVDVTPYVRAGDNQVVVRVDSRETLNQPPFGYVIDYLTYGGIYRDVYLDVKEGAYVKDVFVDACCDNRVVADVTLANVTGETEVVAEILDSGNVVCARKYGVCETAFTAVFEDVRLKRWDLDDPKLYVMRVSVCGDVYETTFGARRAEFTADGFYLNGKKVKIVGLNRHQSYPYVGYAMPESMQRLDADILKNKLGVNAVRTSHYPQSQYFIDECDRLGLLVFTEIPGWQHIGDDAWKKQAEQNVYEMVTQYRNHPSVILWGVRINESLDCDELYSETNRIARKLDHTRRTGGVRYVRKSHLFEDVYTYNDFNRNGASDRNDICDKRAPYLVTEYNGHMFPTKTFDDSPHRLVHVLRYAKMLDDVFASDKTAGCFGWCMFDYNTHKDFGSGDRICYHGVLDMFRNPKWASGVFASNRKEPYLEVCFTSDIGDYPEGTVGDIYCLTNADSIKVYRGGKFIKEYSHKDSPFKHLPNAPILIDDLIGDRLTTEDGIKPSNAKRIKKCIKDVRKYGYNFLPFSSKLAVARVMLAEKLSMDRVIELYGKYESNWGGAANDIVVEAYKNGELVASKTAGSFYSYDLEVTASHTTLVEKSSYDVACVNIAAKDQNGTVCPYVNRAVTLRTEGVIELIGESVVALQGGLFGAYVKTTGKAGKGALYVDDKRIDFEVK
ncbi:MAG: hypothetical protein NC099_03275 [Corallococcus sp.]|nr:hypothetical protein [Corallococcus sp.]